MMNKKELENEIMKTQKQLEALQKKLKEVEDDVPETLNINDGDKYYYVNYSGDINRTIYARLLSTDVECVTNHRAFLSEEYAEEFAKKTQFIADMLHFKYLYDRDYEPNWDSDNELKYWVYYNIGTKKFDWHFSRINENFESVYFSTEQLARKCVKWLNKEMKEND